MFYNEGTDAVYAYGDNDAKPINWDGEPFTFWNLVEERGEHYARINPAAVVEAMEQYHFFHNAKTNEKASINKFWSLSHEERVNILYDYFNEDVAYWQAELEKE